MKKRIIAVVLALFASVSFSIIPLYSQNNLNGYEWLEGFWFGEYDDEYAFIKIAKDYYQIVGNRWNDGTKIEELEKIRINIKVRDEYWTEQSYLSLAESSPLVGIDKKSRSLFVPMGEFETMDLYRININQTALKEGKAKGIDWLYGIWSCESFDRIAMASSLYYIVITPTYYQIGNDKYEYVMKKDKDEEGKEWYCLVDKKDIADYQGSWKEIAGLYFSEDEREVYVYGGFDGDDECQKTISF